MKQVVKNKELKTVKISEADEYKIYAFCGSEKIFKLHRITDNLLDMDVKYAFVSLADSTCYADGVSNSIEEALRNSLSYGRTEIFEFDDEKEFLEWALEAKEEDD